ALLETTDDPREVFFRLAEDDVRDACEVLLPVWERTGGVDGYVSIEVDPWLAYDTDGTFEQAIQLHEAIDRPNLHVKIPATMAGLPAIEDCIARGKSINITLIFSLDRYRAVAEAYLRGLERLVAGGGDPSKVASVASFFVSRVDTVREGVGKAQRLLEKLSAAGVDYDDVVETLEDEGVRKFTDSFDELIDGIRAKRGELAAA